MTYRVWICETCGKNHSYRKLVWNCPGCDQEVCEGCCDRYAHCKACVAGKTPEVLRLAANAAGFEFEGKSDGT